MKNTRRSVNYDSSLYMTEEGWQVKQCSKSRGRLNAWDVLSAIGFLAGGYVMVVLALVVGNALFN